MTIERMRNTRAGGRCDRPAFSLVELTAVAACLVALMALLQPSLTALTAEARQTTCLERLHALASAGLIYAEQDASNFVIPVHPRFDQKQDFVPLFVGPYEWGGKSGRGRPGFCDGPSKDPLTSRYGTACGFGPATRPLNAVLFPHGFRDNLDPVFDAQGALLDTQMDLPVYRCPADDGPPAGAHCPDWVEHPDRTSYDHFGTSYAANLFMGGSSSGAGTMKSYSPYLRPASRIPNPGRTFIFEENIGRWAWACWNEACDGTHNGLTLDGVNPGPTGAVRGWHGKDWRFNFSFADGHAARHQIYLDGTEAENGFARHYRIETVFEDEAQQATQACLIVRGPGWQKDTLPSPPIDTGLGNPGGGGERPSYDDCVQAELPP
ncbi:MAG: type II secretion system protein [Phycisphaerae bacterium]